MLRQPSSESHWSMVQAGRRPSSRGECHRRSRGRRRRFRRRCRGPRRRRPRLRSSRSPHVFAFSSQARKVHSKSSSHGGSPATQKPPRQSSVPLQKQKSLQSEFRKHGSPTVPSGSMHIPSSRSPWSGPMSVTAAPPSGMSRLPEVYRDQVRAQIGGRHVVRARARARGRVVAGKAQRRAPTPQRGERDRDSFVSSGQKERKIRRSGHDEVSPASARRMNRGSASARKRLNATRSVRPGSRYGARGPHGALTFPGRAPKSTRREALLP